MNFSLRWWLFLLLGTLPLLALIAGACGFRAQGFAAPPPRFLAFTGLTTGANLPNVHLSLDDPQGVPLFARIDSVQATVEWNNTTSPLPIVPVVSLAVVDPQRHYLDLNVIEWVGFTPPVPWVIAGAGRRVWVLVYGP